MTEENNRFTRCKMLFGDDFDKIQNSKIIVLGVGGVGSFALDCLYKSGVSDITIVDFDTYDITNQNRQIGSEALGEYKVNRLSILYPGIKQINQKIDVEWVQNTDLEEYDLILDAIDDVKPKVELIKKYYKKKDSIRILKLSGVVKYQEFQKKVHLWVLPVLLDWLCVVLQLTKF